MHYILLLSKAEDYESEVSSEMLLLWQELGDYLLQKYDSSFCWLIFNAEVQC